MLGRGAALRSILPGVVQVPLRGTSAFLLLDRSVTLIDTGFPGSAPRLFAALRSAGRRADEIERIVITHYHPDHLGGLPELQRELPARAAIHAVEAAIVTGAQGPPPPFANPALRVASRAVRGRAFPHVPVRIDEWLRDGDELPALGGMRVVHTPGHTPGHIALYFPQMALLIAGDALEHRAGRLGGPAPAFTEDMRAARRSIRRLAGLEVDVIAFSHFPRVAVDGSGRLRALAATLPAR